MARNDMFVSDEAITIVVFRGLRCQVAAEGRTEEPKKKKKKVKRRKKKKKRKKGSIVEDDDEPLNPSADYRNGWEAIRSLQSTIGRRYVSTAQVLQVVQRLPSIDLLRVEGIISLFGRIVDLDKFHELWRELTHEEGDELIHRIGYLNAGNPMAMEWGRPRLQAQPQDPRRI